MANEFGLIFRKTGDTGPHRTMSTTTPDEILQNMEMFLSKWQNELTNREMHDDLNNIKKHLEKGCSCIP